MSIVRQALIACAAAASALAAAAQPAQPGIYLVAAGGANQYDYDCWFFSSCETVRTNVGKFGGGYRFGHFGIEGWYTDFGRARINSRIDTLHVKATGANAVWYANFGPNVEGLLRAGAADVWQGRSDDGGKRSFNGTFGLGLLVHVAPALALEIAWDVTGSEGNNTSSTVASAVTAGIRLKF